MIKALAALGVFLASIAGALFYGRRKGAQTQQAKHEARAERARQTAEEIHDEIGKLNPDDVRRGLHRWMRDDK